MFKLILYNRNQGSKSKEIINSKTLNRYEDLDYAKQDLISYMAKNKQYNNYLKITSDGGGKPLVYGDCYYGYVTELSLDGEHYKYFKIFNQYVAKHSLVMRLKPPSNKPRSNKAAIINTYRNGGVAGLKQRLYDRIYKR